jgi:hypothetical protein
MPDSPTAPTVEIIRTRVVAEIVGITVQGVTQRLRRGTMRGVSHRRKWWVRADNPCDAGHVPFQGSQRLHRFAPGTT